MRRILVSLAALIAVGMFLAVLSSHAQEPELSPDPVSRLAHKLATGEAKLEYKGRWGYLESLLKALDLPIDSQVMVFSRTSLQQEKIGPKTPRAIFFNDTVSVGSVQNGELYEIAAEAADDGVHFYTLDTKQVDHPRIEHDQGLCILCHNYTHAAQMFVENSYAGEDGTPAYLGGDLFHVTDHRTPFEERWGGWYVSGTSGKMHHLGNAVAHNPYRPVELETTGTQNLTSLKGKFDVTPYLSPDSDMVALMVLEHQTRAMYFMAALNEQFRQMESPKLLNKEVQEPDLAAAVDNLVSYLTFSDEAPLTDTVKGVSSFTQTFPQRGPRDPKGRSLRDFDLKKHLFRYPLSFTIYSDVFDDMTPKARERVYKKLHQVLSDGGPGHTAALEILRATKKDLPDYYR